MNVSLINYTSDALTLLLRTKGTRLAHNDDPALWSDEKRAEHLAYMRDTIKSSWEMVDYVFEVSEVTRAFTHQLVRTRMGSYAQEAMRVKNAAHFGYMVPPTVQTAPEALGEWFDCMAQINRSYQHLVARGVPLQDARGVLPTNVLTSIICKFNLRTLHNMGELRLCTRTQGEYQNVFREMKRLVVEVHPWAEEFIEVFCVNHAHCAFPRYGAAECPVYQTVLPNAVLAEYRQRIKQRFDAVRYEARPVAKDGMAM